MYFKISIRRHPETGALTGYYRLVESYRNADDRVCHRTLLNVGFMEDTTVEQRNRIQKHLTSLYERRGDILLFPEEDKVVNRYVAELWNQMIEQKRIDTEEPARLARMINADTMQHTRGLDIGAERICYDAWQKLQLGSLLTSSGWSTEEVQLAAAQIISRAVYPASELETSRWIRENSAVCELTGCDPNRITKDKLYEGALKLYRLKDTIEKHLSRCTSDLFDLRDKIVLYDLTNTYFEGQKSGSKLAMFGRSKEKRSDARLVVLALVVNTEGFIKYSAIHQGNIADCATLSGMIDKLAVHTMDQKAVVVLDAGIATAENLQLITQKGYHYLCVSRTRPKEYEQMSGRLNVLLETQSKQNIRLRAVTVPGSTDYYLEVKSPAKEQKEQAMAAQFEARFEERLQSIAASLTKKGGVKKVEKVYERIGRAKEKYPSVHHYYNIEVTADPASGKAVHISWQQDELKKAARMETHGVYLLRTSLPALDEVMIWNIYNTIREIESTFRTLKTDLDLRPIYHKNDDATMAHLHLGILAYWLVNTTRYQLKGYGVHHCWKEIIRIGNTQKLITTKGQNKYGETIMTTKCTNPNENLTEVFNILKLQPFARKQKSVVHKLINEKNETQYQRKLPSG